MADYLAFIGLALSVICFMINRPSKMKLVEMGTVFSAGLGTGRDVTLTKLIYMVAREFPHSSGAMRKVCPDGSRTHEPSGRTFFSRPFQKYFAMLL